VFKLTLGITTIVFCTAMSVSAEVYQYHPKSPLRIGGGFNPLRADRAFPDCIEPTKPERLSEAPPETTFDASLVRTRKELYHHLQIDASLSASYGLFSAAASFSLDQEYSFSENDVMWTVRATTDYGRYAIRNPRLTAEAQRLSRDPSAFEERCGREYVSQERRIAHAVAVYHFHNLTESERRHVTASLEASYGSGPLSVGGSMKLNEITNSLKSIYQVKISVYAIGGEGIVKLKDLTIQDDLDEVRLILKGYVEGLTESRATPVEFLTSSWQNFGVNVTPPVMPFRRAALSELYFLFRSIQTRLEEYGERLRTLLARPQSSSSTAQEIQVLQQQYGALSERLKVAQQRGLNCLREPESLCSLDISFAPLPPVPAAEFELRWVGLDPFGRRYSFDFFNENSTLPGDFNFHAILTSGLPDNTLSVRITEVQLIGPFPAETEDKGTSHDARTFKMFRHPNGVAQKETRRIFYEVLQRTCVKFCFGEQ
jgi:hypothetical protein